MTRTQPPEGRLIEEARETRHRGLSQNRAADLAGMSGTRWRQLVNGTRPTVGPNVNETVARMAVVVGVTPEEMAEAGREDVAAAMRTELQRPTGTEGDVSESTESEGPVSEEPATGTGRIRGWPLRANEELWWEPQDPNLPGSPAIRYVYRWSDPDNPDDYIESSKGMDPSRDPLEVAELFREMLAEVHGSRILGNPERAPRG